MITKMSLLNLVNCFFQSYSTPRMAASHVNDIFHTPLGEKTCFNCVYNWWGQPEDRNTIQRCAKCKLVSYCSKECQKEHWMKVHKKHCKYLAEEKVMPLSMHEEANCTGCKKQKVTGRAELSKPDNPVLGCHLSNHSQPHVFSEDGVSLETGPLPFPLGEMSGHFSTKVDATLSLMGGAS